MGNVLYLTDLLFLGSIMINIMLRVAVIFLIKRLKK